MKVGFVGLGNMGRPMAASLLRAGFELTVHDLRRDAAADLLAAGATWASSPRELAARCETVISSLPGPAQVAAVARGERGLLAGLEMDSTWIEMSTSSATLIRELAGEAGERGAYVLDAPVTGAVDGAEAGTLIIFVGGAAGTVDRQRPVLEAMGSRVFHAGPLGAGLAAKLLTNLLWFINAVAIGEAMVLGAKAGIELTNLWEIIKSSAGNSWVAEHDVPSIFRGDYDPTFTLALCTKDLALIHQLGRELGVPLELGGLAEQIFRRAEVQYGRDQGEMHVVKVLEDITGTRLQVDGFAARA
ncbi:MAG: NAD(P)-dependent oxidoreductase [Candidatus Promineifilaceae bacterium]|nr:NAD(P)-dependent oxidoreductase [Candidatus Promineifilaceae bacterium]